MSRPILKQILNQCTCYVIEYSVATSLFHQEDVRQITESLGGVFEPSLKLDTTFLIADQPDGDKYRVSKQVNHQCGIQSEI